MFPAIAGLASQTQAVFKQRGIDASAFADMAAAHTFAPPIVENAAEIDQFIGNAIENVLLDRAQAGPALRAANARARALVRP